MCLCVHTCIHIHMNTYTYKIYMFINVLQISERVKVTVLGEEAEVWGERETLLPTNRCHLFGWRSAAIKTNIPIITGGAGRPRSIALHFTALHRCCVSYQLKPRPSTSQKPTTHFIARLVLSWCLQPNPRYLRDRPGLGTFTGRKPRHPGSFAKVGESLLAEKLADRD